MTLPRLAVLLRAAFGCGLLLTLSTLSTPLLAAPGATVTLLRTPHGGIQPQAAVDGRGVLHLIYPG